MLAALVLVALISAPFLGSSDEEPSEVAASEEAATTTERSRPAPTTTVNPEALRAAYDAAIGSACARAAEAPLNVSTDQAIQDAAGNAYRSNWNTVGSGTAFRDAVAACATGQREARLNAECGGSPNVELMNRDPEQFSGQCFTLTFSIVQFDQGTGRCAFRARFDNSRRSYNFEYAGENALVAFDEPCPGLDPVGTDDVVRVRVVSLGGVDYDTTLGGSTSAAAFRAVGPAELIEDK